MNAIDSLFQRRRVEGRKAFIPFVAAGDPNLAATQAVVTELIARGADLIEIGFPYSDPIADGPVIQASYTRALARGIHLDEIFETANALRQQHADTPFVGMVSYSLVHRRGIRNFVATAKQSGFSGLIVPDLPFEESEELANTCCDAEVALIQLVTPMTPLERARRIAARSTGFLYCVSITGITGARDQLPFQVKDLLVQLRQATALPLCVGFGISKPEHVRLLRDLCDGVIVGSAFVRHLEDFGSRNEDEVLADIGNLAASLQAALH